MTYTTSIEWEVGPIACLTHGTLVFTSNEAVVFIVP